MAFIALTLGIIAIITGDFSVSHSNSKHIDVNTVENSAWDGSVWQVESWLESNLKDPDSLEVISWSPVYKTATGEYKVRVTYRAKNSFSGYVMDTKTFLLNDDGEVVGY